MMKAVLLCLDGKEHYVALTKGWAPFNTCVFDGRLFAMTAGRTAGGFPVFREIPAA